jgi:hypothetical protein
MKMMLCCAIAAAMLSPACAQEWQHFTPQISGQSGKLTAWGSGRWTSDGDTANFSIQIEIDDGSELTGGISASMPFLVGFDCVATGSGDLGAVTGFMQPNTSSILIHKYDGSFPARRRLSLSGTCEHVTPAS